MNLIPFNESFERAVIAGVLADPLLLPKVNAMIVKDDFYKDKHKEIFGIIGSIEPDKLDSLTVEDRLKDREETLTYFQELVRDSDKLIPNLANVIYYAEEIKGKAKLRAGIDLGREIAALCYTPNADPDEVIQTLEDHFARFLRGQVLDNRLHSTEEAFKTYIKELVEPTTHVIGTQTGFKDLDYMIHTLEGLVVLAARPSMGKTSFALNIARNVAETKPVLMFSVEQSQEQVFQRLLSSEAEVNLEHIRTGAFLNDGSELDRMTEAKDKLLTIFPRFHVDEKANIPTSYVTSVAREKKYEWGEIGLIVVDYLHLMRLNGKQTVDALGDACKELRALGKELNCPVLLLSQLSRTNEQRQEGKVKNRRPELTDLRSSGEIEQSADLVIFLYREGYYTPMPSQSFEVAEVIVKKNRNGRQGIITLDWWPTYTKFKNPTQRRI